MENPDGGYAAILWLASEVVSEVIEVFERLAEAKQPTRADRHPPDGSHEPGGLAPRTEFRGANQQLTESSPRGE
jgi:hypothetical protein